MTDDPAGPHTDPALVRPPTVDHLEFRWSRLQRIRWFLSGPSVIGLVALCVTFTFHGTGTPNAQSLITDGAPLWPALFGAGALVQIVALAGRRFLTGAHVVASMIFTFYLVSLLWTAFLTHVQWAPASVCGLALAYQLLMTAVYAKGR